MSLSTECIREQATVGVWSGAAQDFKSSPQPLAQWQQQNPIDWVLTEVQTEGVRMAAHERRGCLVAADFTCKRLYANAGSGGATATWCYAEVAPKVPENGRLLHTLTDWGLGESLGNGQFAPL